MHLGQLHDTIEELHGAERKLLSLIEDVEIEIGALKIKKTLYVKTTTYSLPAWPPS